MVILSPLLIVLFSYLVARIGSDRKFGFWGYFFASLLLTPIIGCLLVLASDPAVVVVKAEHSEPVEVGVVKP